MIKQENKIKYNKDSGNIMTNNQLLFATHTYYIIEKMT